MLSINSPRLIELTSKPLNFEYRVNFMSNCRLPIADCQFEASFTPLEQRAAREIGNWQLAIGNALAVFSRFSQVVVDHPTSILLCLCNGRVAALFVATDLVFRVETLENELARRNN